MYVRYSRLIDSDEEEEEAVGLSFIIIVMWYIFLLVCPFINSMICFLV